LFAADSKALYVEPGYLLFMRGSTLFAQAFDPERLTTRGEPVPVARDVVLHKPLGSAAFSASNTGVLAYMGSVGTSLTQLDWRDRTGRLAQSISFRDGGSIAPTLSPDGGRLAFLRFDDQSVSEIWTQDLARGALTRQTSSVAGPVLNKGVWSPDGRELAFASFRENKLSVYRKSVETTQEPQHLADGFLPSAWSPDGQFLIGDWSIDLAKQQSISDWAKQDIQTELAVLTVADGRIRPLWKTPAFETYATLSPDGRWLAYQSNESESWQVYLQAYPPSGRRWQVSTGGGAHPLWRADGKELYFVTEAGMVMKVPVRAASSTIELGKAEPVFDATVQFSTLSLWAGEPSPYAVTRDGSRFLLLASRDRRGVVTVVMNWPESVNLK
jgi:dipeptidyl aminopeptidase/acylaminoacyl peptidase